MMRTLVMILAAVLISACVWAQSPQKMSYQAVIRNSINQLVTSHAVGMKISILQGSTSGAIVYMETQTPVTNANGLVIVELGSGAINYGDFSVINWADGSYFLKTETDPGGGTNYSITGTCQILSVPYAFYATKAGNGFSGSYNDLTNKPSLAVVATSGNYNDLSNKPVADGSETKVMAGTNILVTGSGTTAAPYVVNLDLPHYVGELYGGGIIFYVDQTGKHGLVCGLADLGFEKWSNINDSIGPTSFSSWDGQLNTTKILAQAGHTKSAAKVCDSYSNANYGTGIYSDWCLPSIKQLCLLNNAIFEVNKAIETDGNIATIPITFQSYWSSNEYRNPGSINYAYGYYFEFEKAVIGWAGKSNTLFVRPIRSF